MKKQMQIEKERNFKMDLTNRIWEAATACMVHHKYGTFLIAEDSLDLLRQSEIVAGNLIERKNKQDAKDNQQATEKTIEDFSKSFPVTGKVFQEMLLLGEPVPLNLLFELKQQQDLITLEATCQIVDSYSLKDFTAILFRRLNAVIRFYQVNR